MSLQADCLIIFPLFSDMFVKTNVVSFPQEVPAGVKKLGVFGRKLYSVHTDNSVIKWDIKFAFAQVK